MQDGGVVTVAMISRDACKTSILTLAQLSFLSLTLEMNSQSRMFRSYCVVWFTKDRLMNIHNFPLYSSPSVVFK